MWLGDIGCMTKVRGRGEVRFVILGTRMEGVEDGCVFDRRIVHLGSQSMFLCNFGDYAEDGRIMMVIGMTASCGGFPCHTLTGCPTSGSTQADKIAHAAKNFN